MGISRSYAAALVTDPDGSQDRARKETYRGVCTTCGSPTTGGDGRSKAPTTCRTCAAQRQRDDRFWTRERIIEAIQLYARENGRPPIATEWLQGKRDPRFPRPSSIYRTRHRTGRDRPFATWADAIEAAGFPRPKVGHNVRPYGQGGSSMAREYIVLRQNGDGSWQEDRVESWTPEGAIETAATEPGEYVAILDRYWVKRTVEPVTRLSVLPLEGPKGEGPSA